MLAVSALVSSSSAYVPASAVAPTRAAHTVRQRAVFMDETIMEKALAMKPASPMITPYEDVAFFEWQQGRSKKEDWHQQWLQDLGEMETKTIQYQEHSIKLDFSPRCHCDSHTSHCRLLGNSEPWLLDNFGCGYANFFFNHFQLPAPEIGSVFKMLI